ncbi:hypothetical protein BC941DRAFT_475655 [Chlamydoabsidia padenii]|nr:hypothetical protein BC941DRAFT_475655 [Chlamydoabsidia padenii]
MLSTLPLLDYGELFCSTPSKFIWLYILVLGSTLYGFNRKDQGTLHAGGLYIMTELARLQCPMSYRLGPDLGQDDDDERSI